MTVTESTVVHSVEDFVTADEVAELTTIIDRHKQGVPARQLRFVDRGSSVHTVDGMTSDAAASVYEPRGRLELADLPTPLLDLLDRAFDSARPAICRILPSVRSCGEWTYVEYHEGQYIRSHIDYAVEDGDRDGIPDGPNALHREGAHVAGIGIALNDDFDGGEFYVETSASPELWRADAPVLAAAGADWTSAWFRALPRTRWTVKAAEGTALLYGAQLIHGTLPVRAGRARKLIGFLSQ